MTGQGVLIIAQNDEYHPLEVLGDMIVDWLKAEGIENIDLTKDRDSITGDLSKYNLVIFAMTPRKLSSMEEKALVNFVESGKALMAIHSATVLDPENTEFIEMGAFLVQVQTQIILIIP